LKCGYLSDEVEEESHHPYENETVEQTVENLLKDDSMLNLGGISAKRLSLKITQATNVIT
jgi:hypothetical protein